MKNASIPLCMHYKAVIEELHCIHVHVLGFSVLYQAEFYACLSRVLCAVLAEICAGGVCELAKCSTNVNFVVIALQIVLIVAGTQFALV